MGAGAGEDIAGPFGKLAGSLMGGLIPGMMGGGTGGEAPAAPGLPTMQSPGMNPLTLFGRALQNGQLPNKMARPQGGPGAMPGALPGMNPAFAKSFRG